MSELAPIGLRVTGGVLGFERDRVYSIQRGAFLRQRVGAPREQLWKAPWEIDRIIEDRAAFYALLIDSRKRVPRHTEQVWRIPKDASRPRLLYEERSVSVTELESDDRALYLRLLRFGSNEWVNLRVTGTGPIERPVLRRRERRSNEPVARAEIGRRSVYFDDQWLDTPIYDRSRLQPQDCVHGPAVVEEFGSTTVVFPSLEARVDDYENLILQRRA